jgi:hypothetical protein
MRRAIRGLLSTCRAVVFACTQELMTKTARQQGKQGLESALKAK